MLDSLRRLVGSRRTGPVDRRPSPASDGYHNGIPMRVRDYVLEENSHDRIEWMTTTCDGPPKRVIVSRSGGDWSVTVEHPPYHSYPVHSLSRTTDEEWPSDLAFRRCLWHARQLMEGRNLNPPERGVLAYYFDPPEIEEVDLFFAAPDAERGDPFGEYLRDRESED